MILADRDIYNFFTRHFSHCRSQTIFTNVQKLFSSLLSFNTTSIRTVKRSFARIRKKNQESSARIYNDFFQFNIILHFIHTNMSSNEKIVQEVVQDLKDKVSVPSDEKGEELLTVVASLSFLFVSTPEC